MKDKMQSFHDDLNVAMSNVHAVLEHWGLKDRKGYLVVRRSDKPESYVVLAHPADKSDFNIKLIELHKREVAEPAPQGEPVMGTCAATVTTELQPHPKSALCHNWSPSPPAPQEAE